MDCKHHECKNNDLDVYVHMVSLVLWMSGRQMNPWCGMEEYQKFMAEEKPESIKVWSDFYDKYLKKD